MGKLKDIIVRRLSREGRELNRILRYPRFTEGSTKIFGAPFTYTDSISFITTYEEIFFSEIYKFNPTEGKNIIVDCGANMGVSLVYFSKNYPTHTIIAFEPDKKLYAVASKNIKSLGLTNVELINKAVWDKEEQLSFFSDGGMGGRVNENFEGIASVTIDTVPLKNYISNKVDFLKIDIEGAEDVVINSCSKELEQVGNLFFEYHSKASSTQTFDDLLKIVKEAGFRYHIKESYVRKRPFIDREIICERFDMAINVSCYKV